MSLADDFASVRCVMEQGVFSETAMEALDRIEAVLERYHKGLESIADDGCAFDEYLVQRAIDALGDQDA